MPLHDWTRVDAGLFHDFHQCWTLALSDALNGGVLPADHVALIERASHPITDVLRLEPTRMREESGGTESGLAMATAPPPTRLARPTDAEVYADCANRIAVRDRHGRIVSVVRVVSPGNKGRRAAFRGLIKESLGLLRQGLNPLLIDPFPPGPCDPSGVHNALWEEYAEDDLSLPSDKARVLVSYGAGPPNGWGVSFVAVGDVLPDKPLFLCAGVRVPAPLEASYRTAWEQFPAPLRGFLEGGAGVR